MAGLVAIAGVITPLGLYDELTTISPQVANFVYAPDASAYRLATVPRGNHTFTRLCGGLELMAPIPCPGSTQPYIVSSGGGWVNTSYPQGLKTKLPQDVMDAFSSGTKGVHTTISNFFDIEWRQLTWAIFQPTSTDPVYDSNGTMFSSGRYQQIDSSILDDTYKVVEGLVVDARDGGLGFRNHTIPVGFPHGAEWQEDLLFMEPQTECVNTNLTIDFKIGLTAENKSAMATGLGILDYVLTDRGGFANIVLKYPENNYDRDLSQEFPNLRARAYKGAWMSNIYTALVLNLTNTRNSPNRSRAFEYMTSEVGKSFPLKSPPDFGYISGLSLSRQYGSHIIEELGFGSLQGPYPNPEGLNILNFTQINIQCEGAGGGDLANHTNIFTVCFQMRGVPFRTDGGYANSREYGSRWSAPLYSCASIIKVGIKTVTFRSDGRVDAGLSALNVTSIVPKHYASPSDFPVWGVENSQLPLRDVSPLWGLVSPSYASHPLIKTLRQPSIYLSGYSGNTDTGGFNGVAMGSNIPGTQFPMGAMRAMTENEIDPTFVVADYTGSTSLSMLQRWRNYSATPQTAHVIPNLIWTDLATSAVAGSRGVLGHRNEQPEEAVRILVSPIKLQVKYRMVFAVPALFLALVVILLTGAGLVAAWRGITRVRVALQQASTGRLLTSVLDPGSSNMGMKTKEWREVNGRKEIDLGTTPPSLVRVGEEEKRQPRYSPGDDGVGYAYGGEHQGYTVVNPGLTSTPESTGR